MNWFWVLVSALLAVLSSAELTSPFAEQKPDWRISIGIVQKIDHLVFRPEGTFLVVDQITGESRPLETMREYRVQSGRGHLNFGPFRFKGQARVTAQNAESCIRVGSKKYRGNLLVRPNPDSTFTVVDELGLEEYLHGVLAAEMSPDWPLEALKAQAVVARTFALVHLGKFHASGYDLSDDSRSQAFAAAEKDFPNAIFAVHETEGQVLSWKGDLLPVYFHSCCGGHTSNASVIWGSPDRPPRPLKGVADRYCRNSPQYQWDAYFAEDDISAAVGPHGVPIGKIRSIRIGRRDNAGFAKTLYFSVGRKTYTIRARDFRDWIGNTELKSVKILRIVKKRNGFVFSGRGFGHGVGLCQWGAQAMAMSGKNWRQILQYYFPGASLTIHKNDRPG